MSRTQGGSDRAFRAGSSGRHALDEIAAVGMAELVRDDVRSEPALDRSVARTWRGA